MPEKQNIEFKITWRDEYLKWLVAFANSQGGAIYIGKDNDGKVVGISDYAKLMEDLPNKIQSILGIISEVNLHEEDGKYFIEIITPPYSVPISLRGVYYVRLGSTTQELKGNALNDFLLRKSGKTWDDVVEPSVKMTDIDEATIKKFLFDVRKSGRIPELEELSTMDILDKLRLTENGQFKRAAVVLFGKDPGKFYPNTDVKIGRFGASDDDLKFQETVEGNLVQLFLQVPITLNRKFFVKAIDFEGLQRIEKGEYPVAAVREMLLNSLVHRDYMGSMTQIRLYDDKFSIWNEGLLPQGISEESLRRSHASRPRNPIIADVCFKAGYIDAWGRGTLKIINSCREAGLPEPEISEMDGGILVLLKKEASDDMLAGMGLNERQIKAVHFVRNKGSISNLLYRTINKVGKSVAAEELQQMVEKKVFQTSAKAGSGTRYLLNK